MKTYLVFWKGVQTDQVRSDVYTARCFAHADHLVHADFIPGTCEVMAIVQTELIDGKHHQMQFQFLSAISQGRQILEAHGG